MNDRTYPDRPYVGVGIVLFRGDEVLLAARGKPPRRRSWSIPGGAQELGETVFEAAHRELMEETGVTAEIIGLVDVVDSINRDNGGKVSFHFTLVDVAAEWVSGAARAMDDVPAIKWVKIDDLGSIDMWPETLRVILLAAEKRNARATASLR